MTFEEIRMKTLEDMKERRGILDRAIRQLEYELANPPKPIDWDKVNAQVSVFAKENIEMKERHYQSLLTKEKEETLDPGEKTVLERFRKEANQ